MSSRGKWILGGGRAFPPEEKSWTNAICVFVQVTNRHSTWRNYLYEKAEQNNYTNGSGHFLVFICVSVQKKRLFGLSQQNRYEKEQSRTKKASQRDLCVWVSEYPPNKITALVRITVKVFAHDLEENLPTPSVP